jgi:ribonuclease HI
MTITVSTDGSALGNPNGPMGWAWADHGTPSDDEHRHAGDCDAGGATNGTNQIGELCAVLEALRAHPGSEPLIIETDSQYAINCSTKWVHGWKKNGWKNSQKKPVKNAELIRAIDDELSKRPGSVQFAWVKGHAGNAGNEKVDELARTYAGDCRSKVRDGYLPKEGWQSLLASEYSQGTDVPEDARMLLDGRISTDEYHLGRTTDSTATGSLAKVQSEASLADELLRISDPETHAQSITEMLVEPEGYGIPEQAAENEAPSNPDLEATAVMETEPTRVLPINGVHQSYAQMLVKHDYFPREGEKPADKEAGSGNENDGMDVQTSSSDMQEDTQADLQSPQSATQTPQQPQDALADLPKLPHRPSPSGLSVSGTVRFTPPPNSSPTFDGKPRLIRGYIAVEGYVTGDGILILDEAPFAVKHA